MNEIQLVLHHNMEFSDQVVYATGHAYKSCEFHQCTIVYKGGPSHFEGCEFIQCAWHLDIVLHDPQQTSDFLRLVKQIDAWMNPTESSK